MPLPELKSSPSSPELNAAVESAMYTFSGRTRVPCSTLWMFQPLSEPRSSTLEPAGSRRAHSRTVPAPMRGSRTAMNDAAIAS